MINIVGVFKKMRDCENMNAKIIGVNLLDSPLLLLAIVLLFELGFSSAEYECG